ncbi:MAG: hypothetical protein EBQ92_00215 [Proteobacteria bacterium]|nr:hypothetical protein [Pseudomonadota bacterium]
MLHPECKIEKLAESTHHKLSLIVGASKGFYYFVLVVEDHGNSNASVYQWKSNDFMLTEDETTEGEKSDDETSEDEMSDDETFEGETSDDEMSKDFVLTKRGMTQAFWKFRNQNPGWDFELGSNPEELTETVFREINRTFFG